MGGFDIVEILKVVAGIGISLIFVVGVIVGIVYLIRSSLKGSRASTTPPPQGEAMPASAPKQEAKPPAAAQLVCPECGAVNTPENNFCEQCGASLK